MFIVLDVWTPGVVSIAEAWITLGSMIVFVGMAYCQDRKWFVKPKHKAEDDNPPDGSEEQMAESHETGRVVRGQIAVLPTFPAAADGPTH